VIVTAETPLLQRPQKQKQIQKRLLLLLLLARRPKNREGGEDLALEADPRPIASLGANVIAMPAQDLLEAEARAMMAGCPVAGDPNFSPIRARVAEGATRADVLAGLRDALAKAGVQPKSWAQLEGWVKSATQFRQSRESAREGPRARDGPASPAPPRSRRVSASSVWGDIADGRDSIDYDGAPAGGSGLGAGSGPLVEGRAGSV
jgi:hypothetical protein